MRRKWYLLAVALFSSLSWTARALAADAPASQPASPPPPRVPALAPIQPAQIDTLIEGIIRTIYAAQNKAGHWDPKDSDPAGSDYAFAGTTALCTYALLAAGESQRDPRLVPAIDWLRKAKITGVYVAAVRLNAFSYLPPQLIREEARNDLQFLLRSQIPMLDPKTRQPNPAGGLFDYTERFVPSRFDHSASQYAVLGIWAAEQMGLPPSEGFWRDVETAWHRDQTSEGGWCYGQGGTPTGSMTAAGVATLFITQDYLRAQAGVVPRGNVTNEPIERGVTWLATRFSASQTPGMSAEEGWGAPYYWLYAVERVGLASGLKYLGEHNWFDEGARVLARHYSVKSGRFSTSPDPETAVREAAFSLLFLARGQRPVLVNKLQYEGYWNQRPRDAANLTHWYAKRYESELRWQIAKITGSLRELTDAPVLYIAGSSELEFTAEQKRMLKQYVQSGGLILANANGQDQPFIDSFKRLAEEMFPQYPMRPLPADSPAMDAIRLKKPFPVLAQSNGVRELCVLLAERDPARLWQSQKYTENSDAFDVAGNIFAYASDRGRLRKRGDTHVTAVDPAVTTTRQIKLARIQHAGNWDPEPGGWRRMAGIVHNENLLDLQVDTVTLGDGKLPGYKLAHLTGTGPIDLSAEQVTEIRSFIARGGTLLIDAAGGSALAAASGQAIVKQLMPEATLSMVSAGDSILADTHPIPAPAPPIFSENSPSPAPAGAGPLVVEYRRTARAALGPKPGLQLRGLRVGSRWAVILSPQDLSAGLVGQEVDGILGYAPGTATEIVRRIVVNSAPRAR